MNLFGKFLIWMVMLAALGALGLTAKATYTRNSWTKDLARLEKEAATNQENLDKKSAQLAALEQQLHLTLLRWNHYWVEVPTTVDPAGTIQADIGQNAFQLMAVPEGKFPLLHAFQPGADGQFKYVRAFQVTAAEADRCALQPVGSLRPNEIDTWQSGNWRFRESIPAASVDRFTALLSRLAELDERLATKTLDSQQADQQIAKATEQLNQRLGELLGDPNAVAGPDSPPEFTAGLIKAFDDAVAARDASLAEVDRLRHELVRANEELHGLIEDNRRLMGLLPKPQSDVARRANPADANEESAGVPARN